MPPRLKRKSSVKEKPGSDFIEGVQSIWATSSEYVASDKYEQTVVLCAYGDLKKILE